jgi:hypothetical protein
LSEARRCRGGVGRADRHAASQQKEREGKLALHQGNSGKGRAEGGTLDFSLSWLNAE